MVTYHSFRLLSLFKTTCAVTPVTHNNKQTTTYPDSSLEFWSSRSKSLSSLLDIPSSLLVSSSNSSKTLSVSRGTVRVRFDADSMLLLKKHRVRVCVVYAILKCFSWNLRRDWVFRTDRGCNLNFNLLNLLLRTKLVFSFIFYDITYICPMLYSFVKNCRNYALTPYCSHLWWDHFRFQTSQGSIVYLFVATSSFRNVTFHIFQSA